MRLISQLQRLIPLLAVAWQVVPISVSAPPNSICAILYQQYPDHIAFDPLGPNATASTGKDARYKSTSGDYWNIESADYRAACIFYPSSAQQVSYAVKALNAHPSVKFALKSGGHNSNLGFSSTNGGVLISFRPNLASTTVSSDGKTADVEPGSRWDEAISTVNEVGRTIVGGRLGHVGVGGYTLGGGLSFLTSQYGFAADTVTNYEVVLANGMIEMANEYTNSELFWALKGGGNAYAIVTKFTFKTFEIGQVWGGTRTYSANKHVALLAAVSNYTRSFHDAKSAIIPTFNFGGAGNLISLAVVFFFYDGPSPPPGVFDEFDAIHSVDSTIQTQSYPALLKANNAYSLTGMHYQIRTSTYPQFAQAEQTSFYKLHYDSFKAHALVTSLRNVDFQIYSFAIQPIPVALMRASEKAGGNVLGLDAANGDKVFFEYDISWTNPACNTACPQYIKKAADAVKEHHLRKYKDVKPTQYQSGDVKWTNYNPLFMNDGMYDQPILESYGEETYQRLKSIASRYDPKDFFAKRQGGFKFGT